MGQPLIRKIDADRIKIACQIRKMIATPDSDVQDSVPTWPQPLPEGRAKKLALDSVVLRG